MNVYETEMKDLERKIVLQTTQLNVKGTTVANILFLQCTYLVKVQLINMFYDVTYLHQALVAARESYKQLIKNTKSYNRKGSLKF